MTSMEIVIAGDNLNLEHVIKALKEAGFDATPRH